MIGRAGAGNADAHAAAGAQLLLGLAHQAHDGLQAGLVVALGRRQAPPQPLVGALQGDDFRLGATQVNAEAERCAHS
ncbi:hypothetical protein D3C78_1739920 [compost metagenome]